MLKNSIFFFHPDFTVGTRISLVHTIMACGLYRRLGISPDLEDKNILKRLFKKNNTFLKFNYKSEFLKQASVVNDFKKNYKYDIL